MSSHLNFLLVEHEARRRAAELKKLRLEQEARTMADEILIELRRARQKFPGDNVNYMALGEEFGELSKALMEEPAANVRKEAIQVAAMAMRVAMEGDPSVRVLRRSRKLDRLGV